MKRLALFSVVASAALALAASAVPAAPQRFTPDPAHSEVGFSVRHMFSRVPGHFSDFTAVIMLDEKNLAASSVEATVKTTSVDTGNERRDGHLRTADFFDVEKYPDMTFKSTKVTAAKDGKFKMTGNLTIRDITKPVTFDGGFLGSGPTGIGGQSMGYRAGFDATATINRKDFGIVWNKTLDQGGALLGDDVVISLHVEAIREEAAKQ